MSCIAHYSLRSTAQLQRHRMGTFFVELNGKHCDLLDSQLLIGWWDFTKGTYNFQQCFPKRDVVNSTDNSKLEEIVHHFEP